MRKGIGIAVGLLSISLFVTFCMRPKQDVLTGGKEKRTQELQALNAMTLERMSEGKDFSAAMNRDPESAKEYVQWLGERVPKEAFSGSNKVVAEYDGTGGWVVDDLRITPNFPQELK